MSFWGHPSDFKAAWAWAEGVCLVVLGPVKGPEFARTLSAERVLRAWVAVQARSGKT